MLSGIDTLLFLLFSFSVLYLLVYALASFKSVKPLYSLSPRKHRFLVLFPAYREDSVILSSVSDFLKQDYPKTDFDVVVIADQLQPQTLQSLQQAGAAALEARFEHSSKANSLKFAMETVADSDYDMVVILDADNKVDPDFLNQLNDAYYSGANAIQAHRVAKNSNTETAILDAVSEEINNSIFRKGHVALGISAALSGSGMAFDYNWFKTNVKLLNTAGEDKELEVLLLKQEIYIDYLQDVKVYDEKTQKSAVFYNQRRRWLGAQFATLSDSLSDLPNAILNGNFDYVDKLVQWMMLPRSILIAGIGFIAVVSSCIDWRYSLKWWFLLFMLGLTLFMAIPDELVTNNFKKAIRRAPLLAFYMVLNLFRLKGSTSKFIHTEHGIENESKL